MGFIQGRGEGVSEVKRKMCVHSKDGLNKDLFSYFIDFGKRNNVHALTRIILLLNKISFVQNIVYLFI